MHDATLPGAGRPAQHPGSYGLRAALNGRVIAPGDPGYDQAGLWVDLSWIRLAIDLASVAAFVSASWEVASGAPRLPPPTSSFG